MPGFMTRPAPVAALLAGLSLTLAGATHAKTSAAGDCTPAGGMSSVKAPQFVRNIPTGETGWFSSPGLVDLNHDGSLEIVAPFYSTFVFDAKGTCSERARRQRAASTRPASSPTSTATSPRDRRRRQRGHRRGVRLPRRQAAPEEGLAGVDVQRRPDPRGPGLAAADLNGDGRVEVVVTTTNTSPTGAQVFVFNAHGRLWHPRARRRLVAALQPAVGRGNDALQQVGNHGYGAYGENVAIGNIDDDPQLEIIITFDNHQINAFNDDGTSILASPWFTNRESSYAGRRLGWGQFIRWVDPAVEGASTTCTSGRGQSAARRLAAVDRVPAGRRRPERRRQERGGRHPQRRAPHPLPHAGVRVHGARRGDGDGGARSARRHAASSDAADVEPSPVRPGRRLVSAERHPRPTVVDLAGDSRPEIVAALPRQGLRRGPTGHRLWRYQYAPGRAKTFASEVVAADLNKDGKPELVFGTYALHPPAGRLVVLSAHGKKLSVIRLPHQGHDGNGIGVPAAPSIGDLDGNGTLEIVLTTFDHGVDIYTVPGSGTAACRGRPAAATSRNGTGPATAS